MRRNAFLLIVLAVAPAIVFGQTDASNTTQNSKPSKHKTMTGCLSGGTADEYRLKDDKGKTVLLYSTNVELDAYVGKSVTVVGDQSATPSTDTGTGRPLPHFKVIEARPGSGRCK